MGRRSDQIVSGFNLLGQQQQAQKKEERQNKLLEFNFFSGLISKNIDDPVTLGVVTKMFKKRFSGDEEFGTFADSLSSIKPSASADPDIEAELTYDIDKKNEEQIQGFRAISGSGRPVRGLQGKNRI